MLNSQHTPGACVSPALGFWAQEALPSARARWDATRKGELWSAKGWAGHCPDRPLPLGIAGTIKGLWMQDEDLPPLPEGLPASAGQG